MSELELIKAKQGELVTTTLYWFGLLYYIHGFLLFKAVVEILACIGEMCV